MSHLSDFLSLVISKEFASATLGGIFVLAGTMLNSHLEHKKKITEQQEFIKSILQSISTELEALLNRYKKSMGVQVSALTPNSSLNFTYSLTESYLTVFEKNAGLIGHIKNKKLRDHIITIYIDIKSFLDSIKLNTQMFSEHEGLKLAQFNSQIPQKLQALDNARKEFAAQLKQEHDALLANIPQLISEISNAIVTGDF